jgi:hypothetical protein
VENSVVVAVAVAVVVASLPVGSERMWTDNGVLRVNGCCVFFFSG